MWTFCLRSRANTDTRKSLKQFKKVAQEPWKTPKLTYIRTQPEKSHINRNYTQEDSTAGKMDKITRVSVAAIFSQHDLRVKDSRPSKMA